jgi:anhydro-N-acetylmuramic acid kinase
MSPSLSERIARIASQPARLVVGLSSGTSFDGIDAALVEISGHGDDAEVELHGFFCGPFDPGVRDRIAAAPSLHAADLARLDADLGEAFAAAALRVVERCGLVLSDVHIVGSHGQTIYHDPPTPGRSGVTFQIGGAEIVARRTGLLTVSDFRSADVAAGGSGAPLVPIVDWLLFRRPGERSVFLNIGGIANITCVAERIEDVVAFDTGPGNALLDELIRQATGDAVAFDRDGKRALRGRVDGRAVDRFLTRPYFSARPPKSTGKESFGREAARELAELVHPASSVASLGADELDDVLATAARVTARSVADSLTFLPDGPPVCRVVVSGGGRRNRALMEHLSDLLAPRPVMGLDELGMDPDAKEAVAFAVLADRTVAGLPGNVPSATGASRRVVLGKISTGM